MKVNGRNKVLNKLKKSGKKSLKRVKKKKNSLPIAVVPKNATGSSNWDQLAKILKYEAKSSKMPDTFPTVESQFKKNPHQNGATKSKSFQKNKEVLRVASNTNKLDNIAPGSSTKSAFNGICEISNSLPAIKGEKTSFNGIHRKNEKPEVSHSFVGSSSELQENPSKRLTQHVAMDCEMVGTGENGVESMIARVSIVNRYGDCIYDSYVKPKENITDYRTPVSGIRPSDLTHAKDLFTVQKEVLEILEGNILIGHALKNDLDVLFISHPKSMIRDTSRFKPFRELFDGRTPSLKKLTAKLLDMEIQSGEHSSVEDAQAAMQIYLMHKKVWEKGLKHRRKKRMENICTTE